MLPLVSYDFFLLFLLITVSNQRLLILKEALTCVVYDLLLLPLHAKVLKVQRGEGDLWSDCTSSITSFVLVARLLSDSSRIRRIFSIILVRVALSLMNDFIELYLALSKLSLVLIDLILILLELFFGRWRAKHLQQRVHSDLTGRLRILSSVRIFLIILIRLNLRETSFWVLKDLYQRRKLLSLLFLLMSLLYIAFVIPVLMMRIWYPFFPKSFGDLLA
jgi:hypothetical protein